MNKKKIDQFNNTWRSDFTNADFHMARSSIYNDIKQKN